MSVNSTNNNFKVSTVGKGLPQDDWATQTTDPKADSLDDLFDLGTDGSGGTGNSDPIDDYTCGEIQGGAYATGTDVEGAIWLESFPPTLEDVMANNENAVNYLDMVVQRYEKAKQDLQTLKATYEQAINSGTCTTEELKVLNERLPLIDQALARCGAEMDKCTELASELSKTFIDEQRSMKDLNNDNWIGRPYVKGSYYVQYNDDGTTTYIDPISKRPIACPLMDPEYQAEVVSNNSLSMIDATDSITTGQTDLETTDVFLKLNEDALSNSNTYGCPIDIGIPEYFWVERNIDGTGDGIYQLDFEEEQCEEKYALYNEWDPAGGLKQAIPSDLSKYAQVKVTGVKVRSVEIGKTAEGDFVYRHVIEFYNDQTLITRMSIEGCTATDSASPVATEIDGLGNYIAPSSVGMAFHDANRASPIEFDASGFQSTGRHICPDIAQQLGGVSSPGDKERGDASFGDNIGAFRDADFQTTEWTGTDFQPTSHGLGEKYGDYNDCYLAPSEDADGTGPYATFKTGIFITGLRGDITGSDFNDVIQTRGVNEYSTYSTEHMPDEARKILKDDPFYSNFINAKGGNDVVVAGRGDNYITDATFVWINDCASGDDNFIALPNTPLPGIGSNDKMAPNQRTFVHVDGGNSMIYNPDEYNPKNDGTAQTEGEVDANDGSYLDDWYEVIGGGSATFRDATDEDVKNSVGGGISSGTLDADFVEKAKSDPYSEWYDELTSVPDPDEMETDVNWEEVMGSKTDLDAEMDSFFNEMFGDLNSFVGEYQDEQQQGS